MCVLFAAKNSGYFNASQVVIIQRNKVRYTKTSNFDVILREKLSWKRRRTGWYVEHSNEIFPLKARKSGRFFKDAE